MSDILLNITEEIISKATKYPDFDPNEVKVRTTGHLPGKRFNIAATLSYSNPKSIEIAAYFFATGQLPAPQDTPTAQ